MTSCPTHQLSDLIHWVCVSVIRQTCTPKQWVLGSARVPHQHFTTVQTPYEDEGSEHQLSHTSLPSQVARPKASSDEFLQGQMLIPGPQTQTFLATGQGPSPQTAEAHAQNPTTPAGTSTVNTENSPPLHPVFSSSLPYSQTQPIPNNSFLQAPHPSQGHTTDYPPAVDNPRARAISLSPEWRADGPAKGFLAACS